MNKWKTLFNWLGSIQVTLACLAMMMIIIFFGTIAQANIGTFAAQREYFNQWFVWAVVGGMRLPLLPGGLTIGSFWLLNLVAAFIVRFRFERKSFGILMSHFGLILLVAGQGLTQLLAVESQMPVKEGSSSNHSESPFKSELAFTMTSDPAFDEVVSIPEKIFAKPGLIHTPHLPFSIRVVEYIRNADLTMAAGGGDARATKGVGTQVAVRELPPTFKDNERNLNTAYIEILENGNSLGTWLVSMALGAPQSVSVGHKEYKFGIRPKRIYYPYRIALDDFTHDKYEGTEIPKNFSSAVRIINPEAKEERKALIYMNHPLRYQGSTYYQASFAEDETVSIFQVVQNPAWLTPYISCVLVSVGLAIQFLMHLFGYAGRRRGAA